jgi:hypothetical protein
MQPPAQNAEQVAGGDQLLSKAVRAIVEKYLKAENTPLKGEEYELVVSQATLVALDIGRKNIQLLRGDTDEEEAAHLTELADKIAKRLMEDTKEFKSPVVDRLRKLGRERTRDVFQPSDKLITTRLRAGLLEQLSDEENLASLREALPPPVKEEKPVAPKPDEQGYLREADSIRKIAARLQISGGSEHDAPSALPGGRHTAKARVA